MGSGSWTLFWPRSPRWVRWTLTPPFRIQKLEYEWVCSCLFGFFFFFFLHCFCNKSGNSGEKDCNLFVSSYHPDSKMDWITGVWFLIMQGSAKQGQESTDKMSKQKQECNTKNWNIKNNNKKSCVWKRAIMSQLAGAARCRCVNSAKDNVSPARLQGQWWAVGPGRD